MSRPSFTIVKDGPAPSGEGNVVELIQIDNCEICLQITRDNEKDNPKKRRSISVSLNRREALVLGRALFSQATDLSLLEDDLTEFKTCSWNVANDEFGSFIESVNVARVEDGVRLLVDNTIYRAGSKFENQVMIDFSLKEMCNFARSILIICQD